MKTTEINTAQKVTIQYELATLSNRFTSYLIDLMIVGSAMGVLTLLGLSAIRGNKGEQLFMYLIIFPIFIFYTLVSEIAMNGQSIGKKTIGIKVVKLNGDVPSMQDYVMRWMFRFIDIFMSFGSIATLLINASPKSQRLGGILSGTTVIRTRSQRTFTLRDILKISTIDTYEPKYPEICQFNEKEMLFIKKALERERKYGNTAHKKVIKDLSKHVAIQLGLKKIPKDRSKFLRTLINDYIVLTR